MTKKGCPSPSFLLIPQPPSLNTAPFTSPAPFSEVTSALPRTTPLSSSIECSQKTPNIHSAFDLHDFTISRLTTLEIPPSLLPPPHFILSSTREAVSLQVSLSCQLNPTQSNPKESQLKCCLYQISLLNIFSWLISDRAGPSPLWLVPTPGRWG